MSKFDDLRKEMTDYLNDINKDGVIEYNAYSDLFDFSVDLLDKAFETGKKAGPDIELTRKEFDLSNVKTCVNADDVCVGDYGIFADNIGRLKKADATGNKECTGYIKWVENEDNECRFTDEYENSYVLFYPLEGAK